MSSPHEHDNHRQTTTMDWADGDAWKQASRHTLHCLIGCNIGDFGMLIYLQAYQPQTPLWLRMVLAMTAGVATSILLEATMLKIREAFEWREAFRMAITMSFISMLGMEFAENLTDFLLTGGVVPVSDPWFWGALGISLIVGFLAPLPYNYWRFKKLGESCH